MGRLVLILPILGFDIWLFANLGQLLPRRADGGTKWRPVVVMLVAGVGLGFWFTNWVLPFEYKIQATLRLTGFPIPIHFIYQQDGKWVDSAPGTPFPQLIALVNFLTGLALAFFPLKIAEFLRTVKKEVN